MLHSALSIGVNFYFVFCIYSFTFKKQKACFDSSEKNLNTFFTYL